MSFSKLAFIGLLLASGISAASASVLEVSNGQGYGWSPLGVPDTTAYGLVFSTPDNVNTRLTSFSFNIQGNLAQAYAGVAVWNGSSAGASLFTSGAFSATYNAFTPVTITTGGLQLNAGNSYVAYFATNLPGNSGSDIMEIGDSNPTGTGAGFVYHNSGGADPLAGGWDGLAQNYGYPLAYNLTFDSPRGNVPEPASMALLGLGLAGLGFSRRKATKR